jgi:phosphoglycerol geranylgeranyltransferase
MRFEQIIKKIQGPKPLLAVLVDPDKYNPELIKRADSLSVSFFLVGGSRLEKGDLHKTISDIKKNSDLPVILFPGDEKQLDKNADGLLLLSLLSGRNAEYLIEKHVRAAPVIKKMKLKHLPTAYLLVGGNSVSATQMVTQTEPMDPLNADKIVHTCIAAEQLGFKAVYIEAGSGAKTSVAPELIRKIKKNISLPVLVGGGIDSAAKAKRLINAGANLIVVGNALEKNVYLLTELSSCF